MGHTRVVPEQQLIGVPNFESRWVSRQVARRDEVQIKRRQNEDSVCFFVFVGAGVGPSRESRESGYFEFSFHGLTHSGQKASCRVMGDADPGYGSTSKQLSEVALGLQLLEPLTEHAGLTFQIDL